MAKKDKPVKNSTEVVAFWTKEGFDYVQIRGKVYVAWRDIDKQLNKMQKILER